MGLFSDLVAQIEAMEAATVAADTLSAPLDSALLEVSSTVDSEGHILKVVSSILGSEPPQQTSPAVWLELTQLRTAIRNLASMLEAKIVMDATTYYEVVGNVSTSLLLQSMTTLEATAGEKVYGGSSVYFYGESGTLKVKLAAFNFANGLCVSTAAAGEKVSVVLVGLAAVNTGPCFNQGYKRYHFSENWKYGDDPGKCTYEMPPNKAHYRLSTMFTTADNEIGSPQYSLFNGVDGFNGLPAWFNAAIWKDGPTYYANRYIGVALGSYDTATLMFFNPRRV
jgi:hypothetical protein